MNRLIFHYTAAFTVLTFYGGQVCPFVESLTLTEWGVETLVVFTLTFLIHLTVRKKICEKRSMESSSYIFKASITIFMISGFSVALYNYFILGFPLYSGFKLIVGWFLVGFFMALDLTLANRQSVIMHLAETGRHIQFSDSYTSLTKKFLGFSVFTSLSVLSVIYLVIVKDLDWIFTSAPGSSEATISILKEFAFIFAVIMGYAVLVAVSFTKNLRLYLHYQNNTMQEVVNGNLDVSVPVSSFDEFGHMAKYTNEMIKSLRERTQTLQLTQDVSILSLASLAETRDNETGAHIMRTQRYVKALADVLKENPEFSERLTDKNISLMYKSAPLHDIGKVGIPDAILLKPGKLEDEEFKIMKRHPYLGKKALTVAGKTLGTNSFLKYAEEIAYTHHEKWNGKGYPRGLAGEEIPIAGRIMALADVYDALISKRVYKDTFSHEKTKDIIVSESGEHFDPRIVDAFLKAEKDFIRIADKYSDENYKQSTLEAV